MRFDRRPAEAACLLQRTFAARNTRGENQAPEQDGESGRVGMKNQYVGDVRDFGKYGLLRNLAGMGTDDPWCLGVNWYLTPDDASRDGVHTSYLDIPIPNQYRAADQDLLHGLRS